MPPPGRRFRRGRGLAHDPVPRSHAGRDRSSPGGHSRQAVRGPGTRSEQPALRRSGPRPLRRSGVVPGQDWPRNPTPPESETAPWIDVTPLDRGLSFSPRRFYFSSAFSAVNCRASWNNILLLLRQNPLPSSAPPMSKPVDTLATIKVPRPVPITTTRSVRRRRTSRRPRPSATPSSARSATTWPSRIRCPRCRWRNSTCMPAAFSRNSVTRGTRPISTTPPSASTTRCGARPSRRFPTSAVSSSCRSVSGSRRNARRPSTNSACSASSAASARSRISRTRPSASDMPSSSRKVRPSSCR